MKDLISIIIVSFNNGDHIKKCIDSIFKSTKTDFEIIIIDNNSSDETVEIIKKYKNVKLFPQKENLGFSKANNIGFKNSKGNYLLFLNPDTQILDGAIDKLTNFAKLKKNLGIAAPKLVLSEGKTQPSVTNLPTIKGAVLEYFLGVKSSYQQYAPLEKDAVEVEAVYGAAMLIPKNVLEKIKGWNEEYFLYFEDLDLCRKMRSLGFRIYYYPQAEIYHILGASSRRNPDSLKLHRQSAQIYHGKLKEQVLHYILRFHQLFFKS